MTIDQIVTKYGMTNVTKNADTSKEVKSAYCCDLLSRVMSQGTADMALITIHTHMNVIAIAELLDMACVIIPENVPVEQDVINKAEDEGVCLLETDKSAFEVAGLLYGDGIVATKK